MAKRKTKPITTPWQTQEVFRDYTTYRLRPVSEAFLDKLAKLLTDWSTKKSDALVLEVFLTKYGIYKDSFYGWCKRYKPLDDARKHALTSIGGRRVHGALTKEYDSNIVQRYMPMCDPDYKEFLEYKASLKAKTEKEANSGKQVVIIERFPDTPEVKAKKED